MSGRRTIPFGADHNVGLASAKRSPEELALRREAAETSAREQGFISREGGPAPAPQTAPAPAAASTAPTPDRRKRTNRNKAFSTRVTPDHFDRFYAIVDRYDPRPVVGEVFEKAIEALEKALERGQISF